MGVHVATPEPDRLLRLRDVVAMVGLGSSTIYRKMAGGEFPAPVRLGTASVRWREADLKRWMADLQAAR